MSRRGERDLSKERFWRQRVRQWRRSGLSIRAFCKEHGLAESSFYAWQRTIRQRDQEAQRGPHPARNRRADLSPVFVPVKVVPATESALLAVVLGQGRVIRVPPGFDAATLRQLLTVLEERSC